MRSSQFHCGRRPARLCFVGLMGWFVLALIWAWPGVAAMAAAPAPPPATPSVLPTHVSHLFEWRPFLAPFHAVVLHFPIGFVVMAAILELYRLRRPSEDLRRVTVLVLWLSLCTGVIAALFGTMRAGSGGYEHDMLELHRVYGMAVPVLTVVTLTFQRLALRTGASKWTYAYRGLLGATTALLLVAGHYGGNLTHGSNYLTENAPTFMRHWLEHPGSHAPAAATTAAASTPGAPAASPGVQLYVEKVKPVLEAKCIRCHGAEKHKGDYRLDVVEQARKGGESGRTAIKPGEPLESHLVRLILLPRDDDAAMPPSGKEPLTAEETMTVIRWIQQGAPFPDDANEVPAGTNHTAALPAGAGAGAAAATAAP